jgi:hypothetical protein
VNAVLNATSGECFQTSSTSDAESGAITTSLPFLPTDEGNLILAKVSQDGYISTSIGLPLFDTNTAIDRVILVPNDVPPTTINGRCIDATNSLNGRAERASLYSGWWQSAVVVLPPNSNNLSQEEYWWEATSAVMTVDLFDEEENDVSDEDDVGWFAFASVLGGAYTITCDDAFGVPISWKNALAAASTDDVVTVLVPPFVADSEPCNARYEQCGGDASWLGSTCCETNSVCTYSNDWYSQCLPSLYDDDFIISTNDDDHANDYDGSGGAEEEAQSSSDSSSTGTSSLFATLSWNSNESRLKVPADVDFHVRFLATTTSNECHVFSGNTACGGVTLMMSEDVGGQFGGESISIQDVHSSVYTFFAQNVDSLTEETILEEAGLTASLYAGSEQGLVLQVGNPPPLPKFYDDYGSGDDEGASRYVRLFCVDATVSPLEVHQALMYSEYPPEPCTSCPC